MHAPLAPAVGLLPDCYMCRGLHEEARRLYSRVLSAAGTLGLPMHELLPMLRPSLGLTPAALGLDDPALGLANPALGLDAAALVDQLTLLLRGIKAAELLRQGHAPDPEEAREREVSGAEPRSRGAAEPRRQWLQ